MGLHSNMVQDFCRILQKEVLVAPYSDAFPDKSESPQHMAPENLCRKSGGLILHILAGIWDGKSYLECISFAVSVGCIR